MWANRKTLAGSRSKSVKTGSSRSSRQHGGAVRDHRQNLPSSEFALDWPQPNSRPPLSAYSTSHHIHNHPSPVLSSQPDVLPFSVSFNFYNNVWGRYYYDHYWWVIKWRNLQIKLNRSFVFRPSSWTSFLFHGRPLRFTCVWLLGWLSRDGSHRTGLCRASHVYSWFLKTLGILSRSSCVI